MGCSLNRHTLDRAYQSRGSPPDLGTVGRCLVPPSACNLPGLAVLPQAHPTLATGHPETALAVLVADLHAARVRDPREDGQATLADAVMLVLTTFQLIPEPALRVFRNRVDGELGRIPQPRWQGEGCPLPIGEALPSISAQPPKAVRCSVGSRVAGRLERGDGLERR